MKGQYSMGKDDHKTNMETNVEKVKNEFRKKRKVR